MKSRKRSMFEMLENRLLMAVISVINNNDSGEGSLRDAITVAQSGDTLDLTALSGTIALQSPLSITTDLLIDGPGADTLAIDGGNATQLFNITGGNVEIDNLKLTNGNAASNNDGGAIENSSTLTLNNVVLSNNTAGTEGGAIADFGSLTATNCTFDSNSVVTNDFEAEGGAIYHQDGNLNLSSCTFVNNSAVVSEEAFEGDAMGGAIELRTSTSSITNCTFSGNSAVSFAMDFSETLGGAINFDGGNQSITNCTITGGSARWGGGVYFDSDGAYTFANDIIAGNSSETNTNDAGNSSVATSAGHNLVQVTDTGAFVDGTNGDIVGVDAQLLSLASNGGPTQTIALQSTSPAIDAGDDNLAPAADQRGLFRNGTSDIGAFEYNGSTNHTPTVTSDAVTSATSETTYTYNITATDGDNDPITITGQNLPDWLTLTDNQDGTATLTGTPINADAGSVDVGIQVSDGTASSVQSFSIDVAAINHNPTFTSTPTTTATSEQLYSYTITTNDVDGDSVFPNPQVLPSWLTFQDNHDGTATISGTPTNADAGTNHVEIKISDMQQPVVGWNVQAFDIVVSAINHAPTFTSDPLTTATSEQSYLYTIATSDADNDSLTITGDTVPVWLTFTDNHDGTATLAGMPTNSNAGANSVVLTVSDGTASHQQSFDITVSAINHAPAFSSSTTGHTTATSESLYTYTISTTDADGDTLTITAPTKPGWLTLTDNHDGTATLTGTPTNANAGVNSVVLRVGDGQTTTDQAFDIAVSAINHSPSFVSTPNIVATAGKFYNYNIVTTDSDNNSMTIGAGNLPAWLTLADNHDGTATLSGYPTESEYGAEPIVLSLSDGTATVQQSFNINVSVQDTYIDAAGTLHVNGTDSADTIVIASRGDSIRVNRNGIIHNFTTSRVTGIDARGFGGDDSITINTPGIGAYAIGGDGNDTLTGGDEDDILTGGANADKLYGNGGNDRLNGMGGNDRLYGGDGADRLYGGDGNDTIDGGSSIDRFYGEDGNDIFVANDNKKDLLYGGDGTNSAIVDTNVDVIDSIDTFLAPGSVSKKNKR